MAVTEATGAELELRERLRELLRVFPSAVDAEVDVMQVVVEELAQAGVELPPSLAMLF